MKQEIQTEAEITDPCEQFVNEVGLHYYFKWRWGDQQVSVVKKFFDQEQATERIPNFIIMCEEENNIIDYVIGKEYPTRLLWLDAKFLGVELSKYNTELGLEPEDHFYDDSEGYNGPERH